MKKLRLSGFVGDYDGITTQGVKEMLEEARGEAIEVQLFTPGGFIYEGFEVYNMIKQYEGETTVVLGGLVASIGTYISAAFDKVIATESGVFMVHNVTSWTAGDAKEMREEADKLDRANKHIAEMLAKKSGKTVEEITALMDAETWYYGQEIIDEGFADELLADNNNMPRDMAIAAAKMKFKNTCNLIGGGDVTNNKIKHEEQVMNKEELLKKLKAFHDDGDVTLNEVATLFGKENKLVTKEHENALKTANELKSMGIKNPVDAIKEQEKVARNAILDDAFGKEGHVRMYANTMTEGIPSYELVKKIEDLKKDPITIKLAEALADTTSTVNVVEPKGDETPEPKKY